MLFNSSAVDDTGSTDYIGVSDPQDVGDSQPPKAARQSEAEPSSRRAVVAP